MKLILLLSSFLLSVFAINAQENNFLFEKDSTLIKDFELLNLYPSIPTYNDSIDGYDLQQWNIDNFDIDSLVIVISDKLETVLQSVDPLSIDWHSIPEMDESSNDSTFHIMHIDYYTGGTMGMIPYSIFIKEKDAKLHFFYPNSVNCMFNDIQELEKDIYLCIGYEKLDGMSWILKVYVIDISSDKLKFLPSFGVLFSKGYQIQNGEAEFNTESKILEISIHEPIATKPHQETIKLLQKESEACFDITYPESVDGSPIILTTKYSEGVFIKP